MIRKFEKEDIPRKVEWINNPENNRFLHYDIPITIEGTQKWFESHKNEITRYDAVIEVDNIPVGTIGLLSIDHVNQKAEFYIAIGDIAYKGKGVAKEASKLLLSYGFNKLNLNRIYLFTETGNTVAQRLFETVGFIKEGVAVQDIKKGDGFADRVMYAVLRDNWDKSQ